ncbi:hypothetical protein A0256_14535 [Mucilaginibacter sp. PAMC 26640]|nr:hypothetical protein A0256_14535 [Mucilaginibacter sp. PAMC 26640]
MTFYPAKRFWLLTWWLRGGVFFSLIFQKRILTITQRQTLITYYMSYQTIKIATAMILLIIPFFAFGQENERSTCLKVLQYNHINQEYIFKAKDQSTTHLKYLGWLRSKKGVRYKIINSVWLWGQSHHATNRILVYNEHNKYLGNYRLTIIYDLPSFIKGNKLIFKNNPDDSNGNLRSITYVDFDNGIPHEFFRKCNGDKGDVYTFDKE